MTTQHEKLRQIAWLILCLVIVVGLVVAPGVCMHRVPRPMPVEKSRHLLPSAPF